MCLSTTAEASADKASILKNFVAFFVSKVLGFEHIGVCNTD